MRLKNKKGIELSINFVVMLILAIAVFSLGLVFVSKLFTNANKIKLNIDEEYKKELNSIISGGSQVAIYPSRFEVNKGHSQIIAIMVLNSLKEPSGLDNEFRINVKFSKAFDNSNTIFCVQGTDSGCAGGDVDKWLITESIANSEIGVYTQMNIPKNSKKEFIIAATVPKVAVVGEYLFLVNFTYNNSGNWIEYRNPEMFSVLVK